MSFNASLARIARGSELEGKTCGICHMAFEPRILDHEGAYKALRDIGFIREGEIYHPYCLENALSPKRDYL